MRRRAFRNAAIVLALVGVAAATALFVLVRPLPVEVARLQHDVAIEVFGLGTVEGRVVSEIGFELGGALVELDADHGDLVKQGDVLARLHNAEQEARVAKAKAGLINAEAALKVAEAAVEKAKAVLAQRKQSNRRKQALLARQTVSAEVADEAQMEEEVAAAELAVALSEVAVAEATLADARAEYDYEMVLLDYHVLAAPYDALVVRRHKELGTVLNSGEPLFTLVDPATVWTLAYVDEAQAGGIRVGQPAEIRLRSLPRRTIPGHVARIGIESDRVSEERRVYVACDRCPESFHLGEQAEVFVTTARMETALLVPETAVTEFDGGGGTVWIVEEGELRRRKVSLGHETLDSRLEIVEGLPSAALVVTKLKPGLREGRAAKVTEGATP